MPDVPKTDETTTETTDEESKETTEQEQPAGTEPEDESEKVEEPPADEAGDTELPEWAREKLTKANAEAANYRVRAREAEEKLKDAKTLTEVEEIVQQMTADREQAEHALLVENVALKFKLPPELQKRLIGKTREELEADAKELAKFAEDDDNEYVELEGGLNPRDRDPDAGLSPRELAQKHGGRKRR